MLKTRVITAVVLALGFLLVLFFLNNTNFKLFLGLVAILCGWEWAAISGIRQMQYKIAYSVLFPLLLQLLFISGPLLKMVLLIAFFWWLIVSLILYIIPVAAVLEGGISRFYLIAGPITVVPALLSAEYLRNSVIGSPWLLLYALAIVWAMDIGAYFSGKRWGKNKLAPRISPGKTIEGVIGGLLFTLFLCLTILFVRSGNIPSSVLLFIATIFAGGLSVMGDLFESRAKRMSGLKDSGNILPGHGGILDRLDSAFTALPLFTFTLLWL